MFWDTVKLLGNTVDYWIIWIWAAWIDLYMTILFSTSKYYSTHTATSVIGWICRYRAVTMEEPHIWRADMWIFGAPNLYVFKGSTVFILLSKHAFKFCFGVKQNLNTLPNASRIMRCLFSFRLMRTWNIPRHAQALKIFFSLSFLHIDFLLSFR